MTHADIIALLQTGLNLLWLPAAILVVFGILSFGWWLLCAGSDIDDDPNDF